MALDPSEVSWNAAQDAKKKELQKNSAPVIAPYTGPSAFQFPELNPATTTDISKFHYDPTLGGGMGGQVPNAPAGTTADPNNSAPTPPTPPGVFSPTAQEQANIAAEGSAAAAQYDPLIAKAQQSKLEGMSREEIAAGQAGGFMNSQVAGTAALGSGVEGFAGRGGEIERVKSVYDQNIQNLETQRIQASELAKRAATEAARTGRNDLYKQAQDYFQQSMQLYQEKNRLATEKVDALQKATNLEQQQTNLAEQQKQQALNDIHTTVANGGTVTPEMKQKVDAVYGPGFSDKLIATDTASRSADTSAKQVAAAGSIADILAKVPSNQNIKIGDSTYSGYKALNPMTGTYHFQETSPDGQVHTVIMGWNAESGKFEPLSVTNLGKIGKPSVKKAAPASTGLAGPPSKADDFITSPNAPDKATGNKVIPSLGITPNALMLGVEKDVLTGKPPAWGLGSSKSTSAKREALQNKEAAILDSLGLDPVVLQSDYKANSAALSVQIKQLAATERALSAADNAGKQVLKAFADKGINMNNSAYANQKLNDLAKNFGNAGDLRAYQAGLQEVANEYGIVFSRGGTGGVHVGTQDIANKIFNGDISLSDLQKVLAEIKSQGGIAKQASIDEVNKLSGNIGAFLGAIHRVAPNSTGNISANVGTQTQASTPSGKTITYQGKKFIQDSNGELTPL